MPRIRTFIAIDPGKNIRDRLLSLQQKLMEAELEARWVGPDNLHLTLLFLGEVDMITVPKVCQAVMDTTSKHPTFSMSFGGTGCFPNTRRPRIIWVGVGEGAQEVCSLHDDLEGPLLDLGCYRREERKFKPHLTLGRIRGENPKTDFGQILEGYEGWKTAEFPVKELLIMGSELQPKGPQYTVLGRGKLA